MDVLDPRVSPGRGPAGRPRGAARSAPVQGLVRFRSSPGGRLGVPQRAGPTRFKIGNLVKKNQTCCTHGQALVETWTSKGPGWSNIVAQLFERSKHGQTLSQVALNNFPHVPPMVTNGPNIVRKESTMVLNGAVNCNTWSKLGNTVHTWTNLHLHMVSHGSNMVQTLV